jgi:putative tricarboxylic transport membrane protein
MEKRGNYPETIFKFILLILGLMVIVLSLKLGFGALTKPGPGLVPFLAGALILISDAVLILFGKKSVDDNRLFSKREIRIYLLLTVIFGCWVVAMPFLGYVLVTFIATFVFSKIMKLEGWLKPLLLSIGTTLMSYILFDFFLYLDLPRGILG